MRTILTLLLLLTTGLAAGARGAGTELSGPWTLTIHYAEGDQVAWLELTQTGTRITGEYHGLGGPADVTGTVEATNVSLRMAVTTTTGDPIDVKLTGILRTPSRMEGTARIEAPGGPPAATRGVVKWNAVPGRPEPSKTPPR
jgi:hypothetical protein